MVQIVGKYQYVSAENFEEYLNTLGNTEIAQSFLHSTPIIEVQQNGEQWVITVNNKGKTGCAKFKLGEVYEEQLLSLPNSFKSVTTREGNCFRTETSFSADVKSVRIYEFTADGMTVHLSSDKSDVKAKRMYKRL
ncbi:PREDICTED: fatty acid-binding protein 1, liver-like [Dinoponera quadriceps]|uniref:Fatty acid-binding protein 1, liver-like n=1 Tax=Dinoponera quadriceps TaxID=609295 RepID=A0A6P3XQZ8_DINQU|nr:PREDICTED: fatty acid-binding protein 1, liver-like [Dinoponera quadriceps]